MASQLEALHGGPHRAALHEFLDIQTALALAAVSRTLRAAVSPEAAPALWRRGIVNQNALRHMAAAGMELLSRAFAAANTGFDPGHVRTAIVAACVADVSKAQWLLSKLLPIQPSLLSDAGLARECLAAAGCLQSLRWVLDTFNITRKDAILVCEGVAAACRHGKWQLAVELTKRFSIRGDARATGYLPFAETYLCNAVVSGDMDTVNWAINSCVEAVPYAAMAKAALTRGHVSIANALLRKVQACDLDTINSDELFMYLCLRAAAPAAIMCMTHLDPSPASIAAGLDNACVSGNADIVREILRTQLYIRQSVVAAWPQHLALACAHGRVPVAAVLVSTMAPKVVWQGTKMYATLAAVCSGSMVGVLESIYQVAPETVRTEIALSGTKLISANIEHFDVIRWLCGKGPAALTSVLASAPDKTVKTIWLKRSVPEMEWLVANAVMSDAATKMALVMSVKCGITSTAEWLINAFEHCRRAVVDNPRYIITARQMRCCDMVHMLRNVRSLYKPV